MKMMKIMRNQKRKEEQRRKSKGRFFDETQSRVLCVFGIIIGKTFDFS